MYISINTHTHIYIYMYMCICTPYRVTHIDEKPAKGHVVRNVVPVVLPRIRRALEVGARMEKDGLGRWALDFGILESGCVCKLGVLFVGSLQEDSYCSGSIRRPPDLLEAPLCPAQLCLGMF